MPNFCPLNSSHEELLFSFILVMACIFKNFLSLYLVTFTLRGYVIEYYYTEWLCGGRICLIRYYYKGNIFVRHHKFLAYVKQVGYKLTILIPFVRNGRNGMFYLHLIA